MSTELKPVKLSAGQWKSFEDYCNAVEAEGQSLHSMLKLWIALKITSAVLLLTIQNHSNSWRMVEGKYISINEAAKEGCREAIGYQSLINNGKKRYVIEGKRGELMPKADAEGNPIRRETGKDDNNKTKKVKVEQIEKATNEYLDTLRSQGALTKGIYEAIKALLSKISKDVRVKNIRFTGSK